MKKTILAIIWPALSALFICFLLAFSMSFASVNLTIYSQATNSVIVAWPATGLYTLQINNNLAMTNWSAYGGLILSNDGTNSITIEAPMGTEFFRLLNPGVPGFSSPTNISGLTYYWNCNDLPANSSVLTWTDEINGLVLTNAGSNANAPFNYEPITPLTNAYATSTIGGAIVPEPFIFPGVTFPANVTDSLTNKVCIVSSNFSFWAVIRPQLTNTMWLFGNNKTNGIGIFTNVLGAEWSSRTYSSVTLNYIDQYQQPFGQTYDIAYSGGTIYSNGVLAAAGLGQPTNNFPFIALGSMSNSAFNGTIQYFGIWTNYLLTATDASNLDNWYWNYGVTNVTNGLIAEWLFNEVVGTVAHDSVGTNDLIFGGTGNTWTSSSVVGGGSLYFNGNGWATNVNPTFADNLPAMTVSCWIQGTNFGNNDGFLAKDLNINPYTGWAFFADANTNIAFGLYQSDASWNETIHNYGGNFGLMWPIIGDGNWHFLVGSYTNAPGLGASAIIYIDGAQEPGGFNTFTPPTNISCPTVPIVVGDGNNGNGSFSTGSVFTINDLRIYNRQLTLQEVNDLYKWRGQP